MRSTGSEIVARALKDQGFETFFFIMGAPMMLVETASLKLGLRGIDVRHEQAGAMAAHAYARLRNRPGVCIAASGPGTTNLVTGLAHAWADGVPVIALGGASPTATSGRGVFQEIDQLAMMRPCTKWAERAHHPHRLPELVNAAVRQAMSGRPGPAYIDLPGDILYQEVEEEQIRWPEPWDPTKRSRPAASQTEVQQIIELLARAKQPVLISGSGILWSSAAPELQEFVQASGIPFYTTPQGRGVIPEDHEFCFLTARSSAFRDADLIIVVGTRLNYVIGHAAPPRFNADARLIRIDIDPEEIATSPRLDLGVVGDAKSVLRQLTEALPGRIDVDKFRAWRDRLRGQNAIKSAEQERVICSGATPIHPLRLCKEVRDVLDRDAILCVDGQEILNFARQAIPTYVAGHRLNSGVFGTMGVGLPFGLGAKVAKPEKQVVVLHGDGSFGMNAMEFDTAVRHNLPLLVVISNNGGWTADPKREKPGRDLGYTRYDQLAEALGGYGEYIEQPDEIRPALQRALQVVRTGRPALVNVKTDPDARAATAQFAVYST
jgi:thiamine pyrophosphate-dependent acetolactate synthase large subunit-like protein